MSIEVLYHTCNLGNKKTKVQNPFTGEMFETIRDDGLSVEELAAVTQLLAESKAKGPDSYGIYSISFGDGAIAHVELDDGERSGACEGCVVTFRKSTPQLARFVFDLSRAGNMIMTPAIADSVDLVTSEEQLKRIKHRWPNAKVLSSVEELQVLLDSGAKAWQKHLDQVLRS